MHVRISLKTLLVTLLLSLLVGCSTIKVSYRFLDNAIRWKINDYVSLTSSQGAALNRDINKFHYWHQSTQLRVYADFMAKKAVQFKQETLNPQDVSKIYDEVFDLVMASVDELVPIITTMLFSLDAKQIPSVIKNIERELTKDLKEDLARTPKQQVVRRQNRMIKRMAKLVGRLTKSQANLIADWAKATASNNMLREQRHKRLSEVVPKLLNNRSNPEQFNRSILAQFKTQERYASAAEKQSYQQRKQLTLTLMSDLFNSLAPLQKQKLIASVKKYQFDFLSLSPQ
ncbi:DUF6279 family lipoprotein [Leucothrix arctica]|uniref:Lipoprotein n=1 Tax=Leucothrix arctica TaxID=1481894 RepID=A0A317C986_9GAMM|nr:DUF6279 family lipoprotein [Leucothrix arctica]PWQ94741.1 hypothetical protein DKT75_15765 [Leucothrix arctica]